MEVTKNLGMYMYILERKLQKEQNDPCSGACMLVLGGGIV